MRKTRLTAHTAPSALALPVSACGSRWKAHSLKSWPLKGMHLGLKCQLGSARTAGQFLYCWLFAMVKPRPFPAPWGWFIELMKFQALAQSNCIGFLSQYKDFTNCISILPLWLPPPHLKTMSYPEPVALDVQVSLCSGPWGQPSHIHFSLPFKIQSEPAPRLPAAGWVRLWVARGWAHPLVSLPSSHLILLNCHLLS